MPRPPRPLLDGGCYHLIARGNNRQFLFTEDDAFRDFLDCLARAKSRYPAKLYHDCLSTEFRVPEFPEFPEFRSSEFEFRVPSSEFELSSGVPGTSYGSSGSSGSSGDIIRNS